MHIDEYALKMSSSNNLYSKEYAATKDYLYSHCHNPQKIYYTDPYTGQSRFIEVPCGKCLHCTQQKKNEWTTRAYAHLEDFKHCYFVTLTYRSFTSLTPVTRFVMTYLQDALWHYDSFNKNHHLSWNPCVICQKHFQNFMKRLRKNTGFDDITYMAAYEYGHDYGRPHAHYILFSNHELTQDDIYNAWSLKLYVNDGVIKLAKNKDANYVHRFPFGRVDFHDLVKNGSLDQKFDPEKQIFVDGRNMSAANCFAYVCKYIQKKEYNTNRVKLAFDSFIRDTKTYYEDTVECINLDSVDDMCTNFSELSTVNVDINPMYTIPVISGTINKLFNNNLKISEIYENLFDTYCGLVQVPVTCNPEKDYFAFVDYFRPKTRVSLGTPIGSVYAKTHIKEFVEGKFDVPSLQKSGFVVPSYFLAKTKQYIYRFRKVSETSASRCYVQSCISSIFDDLVSMAQGAATCCVRPLPQHCNTSKMFNSKWCYKDVWTGERIFFKYSTLGDSLKMHVLYFKYSRHTRSYTLVRSGCLSEFLADYIDRYYQSFERHVETVARAEHEKRTLQKIKDNYIGDFAELCNKCYKDIENHIKHLDDDWNTSHVHLE